MQRLRERERERVLQRDLYPRHCICRQASLNEGTGEHEATLGRDGVVGVLDRLLSSPEVRIHCSTPRARALKCGVLLNYSADIVS
jgi:hypothetical protein